jgi:cell division protein FtsB
MKKVSRIKRIISVFVVLFAFGSLIIAHVALKKKCDDLNKQKINLEEELQNQNTKKNNLFAKYQNLISEEKIIPYAVKELGMVIADPPIAVITIDKESITELALRLKDQNE